MFGLNKHSMDPNNSWKILASRLEFSYQKNKKLYWLKKLNKYASPPGRGLIIMFLTLTTVADLVVFAEAHRLKSISAEKDCTKQSYFLSACAIVLVGSRYLDIYRCGVVLANCLSCYSRIHAFEITKTTWCVLIWVCRPLGPAHRSTCKNVVK